MKYMKMLGLLAVAAAALMAFAGPASATLTEGAGDPVEAGEVIEASSEGTTSLDGSVDVACAKSTVKGTVTAASGTSGSISSLTFTECNKDTVTVLGSPHGSGGTLAIATNGTVTSTGAEVTVQLHRTVLGFPVTTHCIYKTNSTVVGTLTESSATKGNATLDINSAQIPVAAGSDSACGSTAEWTGSYSVSAPAFLDVD